MPQHPQNCGVLEEIGVVFELAMELSILPHFGREIELGDAGLKAHLLDAESGNLEDLLGNVLEDEHHLEQRMSVQRTLRNQLLDQFLEGKVLVCVRLQREGSHLANYIPEGQVSREIASENQRVHEQTDHVFEIDVITSRDGSSDQNAFLMGVAPE